MKTVLPDKISTIEEAKAFLTELHKNKEDFHPEDDAHTIVWGEIAKQDDEPTPAECDQLNKLMEDIYALPENMYGRKYVDVVFDPCDFLLSLDPDYVKMRSEDEAS